MHLCNTNRGEKETLDVIERNSPGDLVTAFSIRVWEREKSKKYGDNLIGRAMMLLTGKG